MTLSAKVAAHSVPSEATTRRVFVGHPVRPLLAGCRAMPSLPPPIARSTPSFRTYACCLPRLPRSRRTSLLHGLCDDDTAWLRRTSIERYTAPLGVAVVMPQVGRSFYANMAHDGGDYWTFLSEELPTLAHSFFNISSRREDTFVAGLSMGGYGAMKWALRHPDRFAAAASMSGALDVAGLVSRNDPERARLWANVFGGRQVARTSDDLLWLLEQTDVSSLPALSVYCGTGDHVYGLNLTFRDAARRLGVPLTVDFGPGEHEWGYWDIKIQDFLATLPLGGG